ncbi:hypothetical protein OAT84_00625 [Gammaproteobacteria bacterium]|nr:hypothetical protein [Gammaproteobacteria bacterium]
MNRDQKQILAKALAGFLRGEYISSAGSAVLQYMLDNQNIETSDLSAYLAEMTRSTVTQIAGSHFTGVASDIGNSLWASTTRLTSSLSGLVSQVANTNLAAQRNMLQIEDAPLGHYVSNLAQNNQALQSLMFNLLFNFDASENTDIQVIDQETMDVIQTFYFAYHQVQESDSFVEIQTFYLAYHQDQGPDSFEAIQAYFKEHTNDPRKYTATLTYLRILKLLNLDYDQMYQLINDFGPVISIFSSLYPNATILLDILTLPKDQLILFLQTLSDLRIETIETILNKDIAEFAKRVSDNAIFDNDDRQQFANIEKLFPSFPELNAKQCDFQDLVASTPTISEYDPQGLKDYYGVCHLIASNSVLKDLTTSIKLPHIQTLDSITDIIRDLNGDDINALFKMIITINDFSESIILTKENIHQQFRTIFTCINSLSKKINPQDFNTILTKLAGEAGEGYVNLLGISSDLNEEQIYRVSRRIAHMIDLCLNYNPDIPQLSAKIALETMGIQGELKRGAKGKLKNEFNLDDLMTALSHLIPIQAAKDAMGVVKLIINEQGLKNMVANPILKKTNFDDVDNLGSFVKKIIASITVIGNSSTVKPEDIKQLFDAIAHLSKIKNLEEILKLSSQTIVSTPIIPMKTWVSYAIEAAPLKNISEQMQENHFELIADFMLDLQFNKDSTLLTLEALVLLKSLPDDITTEPQALKGLMNILGSDLNTSDSRKSIQGISWLTDLFSDKENDGYTTLTKLLNDISLAEFHALLRAYKAYTEKQYKDAFVSLDSITPNSKNAILNTLGHVVPALKSGKFREAIDSAYLVNQYRKKINALSKTITDLSNAQTDDATLEAFTEPVSNLIVVLGELKDISAEHVLFDNISSILEDTPLKQDAENFKIVCEDVLPHVDEITDDHRKKICKILSLICKKDKDNTLISLEMLVLLKSLPKQLKDSRALKHFMLLLSSQINTSASRENIQGINWGIGLFGDISADGEDGYTVMMQTIEGIKADTFINLINLWEALYNPNSDTSKILAKLDTTDIIKLMDTASIVLTPVNKIKPIVLVSITLNKISNIENHAKINSTIEPLLIEMKKLDTGETNYWSNLTDAIRACVNDNVISSLSAMNTSQKVSKIPMIDMYSRALSASLIYKGQANTDALKSLAKSLRVLFNEHNENLLNHGEKIANVIKKLENQLESPTTLREKIIGSIPSPMSFWQVFKTVTKWLKNTLLNDINLSKLRLYGQIFITGFVVCFLLFLLGISSPALLEAAIVFGAISAILTIIGIIMLLGVLIYDIHKTIQLKKAYTVVQSYFIEMVAGVDKKQTKELNKVLKAFDQQVIEQKKLLQQEYKNNNDDSPEAKEALDKKLSEVDTANRKYEFISNKMVLGTAEHSKDPAIAIYALLSAIDPEMKDITVLTEEQQPFYQECKRRSNIVAKQISQTKFNPNAILPSVYSFIADNMPKGKGLLGEITIPELVKSCLPSSLISPTSTIKKSDDGTSSDLGYGSDGLKPGK